MVPKQTAKPHSTEMLIGSVANVEGDSRSVFCTFTRTPTWEDVIKLVKVLNSLFVKFTFEEDSFTLTNSFFFYFPFPDATEIAEKFASHGLYVMSPKEKRRLSRLRAEYRVKQEALAEQEIQRRAESRKQLPHRPVSKVRLYEDEGRTWRMGVIRSGGGKDIVQRIEACLEPLSLERATTPGGIGFDTGETDQKKAAKLQARASRLLRKAGLLE